MIWFPTAEAIASVRVIVVTSAVAVAASGVGVIELEVELEFIIVNVVDVKVVVDQRSAIRQHLTLYYYIVDSEFMTVSVCITHENASFSFAHITVKISQWFYCYYVKRKIATVLLWFYSYHVTNSGDSTRRQFYRCKTFSQKKLSSHA